MKNQQPMVRVIQREGRPFAPARRRAILGESHGFASGPAPCSDTNGRLSRRSTLPTGCYPLLLAALVLGACRQTAAEVRMAPSLRPAEPAESVLYARDGSVVTPNAPATNAPSRDLPTPAGSRMYLLDLYQKAVEEKEALALEVKGLNAALSKEQAQTESVIRERDALHARLQALDDEKKELATENVDLAARLVTAQIRRLESEKALLEWKIDALRSQAASDDAAPKNAQRIEASARDSKQDPAGHGGRGGKL